MLEFNGITKLYDMVQYPDLNISNLYSFKPTGQIIANHLDISYMNIDKQFIYNRLMKYEYRHSTVISILNMNRNLLCEMPKQLKQMLEVLAPYMITLRADCLIEILKIWKLSPDFKVTKLKINIVSSSCEELQELCDLIGSASAGIKLNVVLLQLQDNVISNMTNSDYTQLLSKLSRYKTKTFILASDIDVIREYRPLDDLDFYYNMNIVVLSLKDLYSNTKNLYKYTIANREVFVHHPSDIPNYSSKFDRAFISKNQPYFASVNEKSIVKNLTNKYTNMILQYNCLKSNLPQLYSRIIYSYSIKEILK